jgi:hypothetical protein
MMQKMFFGESDFNDVEPHFFPSWWLFVAEQPFIILLGLFEATNYANLNFKFTAIVGLLGFFFVYVPLLILGYWLKSVMVLFSSFGAYVVVKVVVFIIYNVFIVFPTYRHQQPELEPLIND